MSSVLDFLDNIIQFPPNFKRASFNPILYVPIVPGNLSEES